MGEHKNKYKLFSIDQVWGGQWHFGLNICKDGKQFYILVCLFKWDICIGKLIDYDTEF